MKIGEYNLTEDQFYGRELIEGSLYLNSLTSIPEGFNPTVGGSLDLESLTSIPEGFNPTAGGYLDLNSLTSIPEGFNPTVGGSLYLRSLTSITEGFNPKVGGSLFLNSITSVPEGFNPTVGGYLDLESLTSIPEGFNPTVGDSLDLDSLTSIPEGFNPTVGGDLYLESLTSIPEGFKPTLNKGLYTTNNKPRLITWGNKYCVADGVFTEILHKKGNVYKVKKLHSKKEFYLVTNGEKYAHGDTIKEAKEDLIYKISNRDKSEYENLKLNDSLTLEQAIECYRVITGACANGVKDFLTSNPEVKQENYTISQMIEYTEGKYGNTEFKEFFS